MRRRYARRTDLREGALAVLGTVAFAAVSFLVFLS
jgi:hypothetical protein